MLNADRKSITIYDILGKPIMFKEIKSDTEEINLQDKNSGIYFIKFNDNNKTIKIIVE